MIDLTHSTIQDLFLKQIIAVQNGSHKADQTFEDILEDEGIDYLTHS